MIFDAIIGLLLGVVEGVLSLVPAYTLPSSITELGSQLGDALNGLSAAFPIGTLGLCITMVLSLRLFIAGFDLIMFVYRLIPFKAT